MKNPLWRKYQCLIPGIRAVSRSMGYAVAVHGSLVTDLDLIAVPWVEDAAPAKELVARVCRSVGGHIEPTHAPGIKPHGRRVWTIVLMPGPGYIDFGVMPLTPLEPR